MNRYVYIAGPISKGDSFDHVGNACHVWRELFCRGVPAFCPHWSGMQQMVAPISWEEWLAYDLPWVAGAAAVLRLPGESRGADVEVRHATANMVPVFTDMETLVHWWYNELESCFVCDQRTPYPVFCVTQPSPVYYGRGNEVLR